MAEDNLAEVSFDLGIGLEPTPNSKTLDPKPAGRQNVG